MLRNLPDILQRFPKVDLHRHLEGSVRPETYYEILKSQAHGKTSQRLADVRKALRFEPGERSQEGYQEKLRLMSQCFVSQEAVERVTYEAIRDAAADRVRYLELRCAPHLIALRSELPIDQVIEALRSARDRATAPGDVRVGFVVNLGRFKRVRDHHPVVQACVEAGSELFCGIGIHGDMLNFPVGVYAEIIEKARAAEMGVTIRAGDARGAAQVVEAINFLGADRIAHGLRVLEDAEAVEIARMSQTPFECCLTANVLAEVVERPAEHPFLQMRTRGIPAVLCTNDPALSDITLTDEYLIAIERCGLSLQGLQQSILDAIAGAFQSRETLQRMDREFRSQFRSILPADLLLEDNT